MGRFIVTLYWQKKYNPKNIIQVYGSFTNPPWTVFHNMTYDPFFDAYALTIVMPVGTQFKFVDNGVHKVSTDYPIVLVFYLQSM